MNIERLLEIALEADKIGDYVTADRVTNLLKTAQGGAYSVYPNQAAYSRTQQQSQQMLQAQQNQSKPATQQMPAMPQMNQQIPAMPQMNQQMPQQGGIYYAPIAPNAVYFNGATIKKPQPQMTEEQKAFADFRGTGIYQSLARSRGVMDQRLQAQADAERKAKQSRINYGPAATPTWLQGSDTSAPFVPNPNTPINPNLYGTGYASMAMAPQQPMPQQPQMQQTYQNYYNNAMMQQQQQSFNPQQQFQPQQPQQ